MTASGISPQKSSPLHEILQWSSLRPEWQSDALRRIIEKGNLDANDIDELERISRAKVQNAAIKPTPIVAKPLTKAHLPSGPGASVAVSLLSLNDLKNVSRLPDGVSLPLGVGDGLVVIYGGNGAGKSSYAKVIKKMCRARGASPEIKSNAFASVVSAPSITANVSFRVGTTPAQYAWSNGTPADPRLASVFVFDAACAHHYLSTDSEASFTPYGLDVLPKLSKICDILSERLGKAIDNWNGQINGAKANWKYDAATKVGQLIQRLNKATKSSDVSALATLTPTELQRLTTLKDALKSDPAMKAKQTRAAKTRVETILQRLTKTYNALSDVEIKKAQDRLASANETALAAQNFAAGQFDTTFLQGTGSELWRQLWEAAREYSVTEAFPTEEFPPTSQDARCVLCQQPLLDDSRSRFNRFDEFCKDKSLELSAASEAALAQVITAYKALADLKPELQKIEADISILSEDEVVSVKNAVDSADKTLHQLTKSLSSRLWQSPAELLPSPEHILQSAIQTLEHKAATEESANDPARRTLLENELKELEARAWLSGVHADVLKQIECYKIVAELEECKKDFNTSAITTKSGELSKVFVTVAYKQRFEQETKKLALNTLSVVLEDIKGKKGVTQFGIRLVNASSSKVAEIASEGEHRCVALAAFLAELSQASHQSALVFDDPVSSLDHWHRQKIAERLVEESANRQVIVFTHEVIFLNDLISLAEKAGQNPHILTLEWDKGAPGKYLQDVPWDHKRPLDCLNALDHDQATIASQWNPQPNAANIAAMRDAYSRFRSTLERIVEAELLDGIVERFQSEVKAGRVKYLAGVTLHEIDETKRLLQKCHNLTNAHAPSSVAIPVPDELKQDLADARQLITTIKARKKTIK